MVIIDTGFFYALADKNDVNHTKANKVLLSLDEDSITTWPVLTETCHLLLKRLGEKALNRFMHSLHQQNIFELKEKHIPRMREMMESYISLPMDLADASLVVLAESMGEGRILTTDRRDFNAYRWKNRHPFTNLMDQ